MKKILLILIALLFILGGCKDNKIDDKDDDIPGQNDDDELPVIDDAAVESVILFIDMLPDEVVESDRQNIIDTRAMYDALTEDEKALVTNLEKLENAEATIIAIDNHEAKKVAAIEKLQLDLDALVPEMIENDIELPRYFETEIGELQVAWYTNDANTLSNTGKVIPGRRFINVELKSNIIYENKTYSSSQMVTVKPITFDALPKSRLSFAYYADWDTSEPFTQEVLDSLDVINYAFATVVNGVVSVGYSQKNKILDVRRSGIRVTLCIGGYGAAAVPFSQASKTEEGRIKLAKSIVDAVEEYHFDGADIDWEYPGTYPGSDYYISPVEDRQNHALLIKELHKQLKAKNPDYILSAAVPAGSTSSGFDIPELNKYLDFFHLMTYDMDASSQSTHHTALYVSGNTVGNWSVKSTVDKYISSGASKEKLVVGAAFYGREFDLVNASPIMRGNVKIDGGVYQRRTITYKNIDKYYLSKLGTDVTRYWDSTSYAPYLFNSKTNQVVVYDDPESIKYKAQYAIETGVAGMMFWEYTQDNGDLLKAIYENLVKGR